MQDPACWLVHDHSPSPAHQPTHLQKAAPCTTQQEDRRLIWDSHALQLEHDLRAVRSMFVVVVVAASVSLPLAAAPASRIALRQTGEAGNWSCNPQRCTERVDNPASSTISHVGSDVSASITAEMGGVELAVGPAAVSQGVLAPALGRVGDASKD